MVLGRILTWLALIFNLILAQTVFFSFKSFFCGLGLYWCYQTYPRYLTWCWTREGSNTRGVLDSFGLIQRTKCGFLLARLFSRAPGETSFIHPVESCSYSIKLFSCWFIRISFFKNPLIYQGSIGLLRIHWFIRSPLTYTYTYTYGLPRIHWFIKVPLVYPIFIVLFHWFIRITLV